MSNGARAHARRHKVANRVGWWCRYCGRLTECASCNPAASIVATMDHIIPKANGGTDAFANLTIACRACNLAKDDGHWPTEAERARFADDERKGPQLVGWKRKRLADPLFAATARACRATPGQRPRKAYQTEAGAQTVVDMVRSTKGVELNAYRCGRCKFWHVAAKKNDPASRLAADRQGRNRAVKAEDTPIEAAG
jgi:hypothetical protein